MKNFSNMQDYFLILQINDALFPIGSYTQSYGLETYVQQQKVMDVVKFRKFLECYLTSNLLYTDILAVRLAYEAVCCNDIAKIIELDNILSAVKVAFETRLASIKLGSRFIKTLLALNLAYTNEAFTLYQQLIKDNQCIGHHSLAYGIACGSLGLDKNCAIMNFSYAQISSTVNNGVKLIPLSQTVGQQLLTDLRPHLENLINKVSSLTIDDLGRSTPAFELRSMQHERLYSRLYMS